MQVKKYLTNSQRKSRSLSKKLMTNDWEHKEEDHAVIARKIEFITDEFAELQEAIPCPNSFIVEIAHKVVSEYQTNQTIIIRDDE
tara:strand:+ start:70 stop:324 length:255 start_codon:yes stop_codon:yes gene_type:complete